LLTQRSRRGQTLVALGHSWGGGLGDPGGQRSLLPLQPPLSGIDPGAHVFQVFPACRRNFCRCCFCLRTLHVAQGRDNSIEDALSRGTTLLKMPCHVAQLY